MLPIGQITDDYFIKEMAKTDNGKYVFKIRGNIILDLDQYSVYKNYDRIYESSASIKNKINNCIDNKFICVSVKSESYTYPKAYKMPFAYYKNLKPMTIKEFMRNAADAGLISTEDEYDTIVEILDRIE